MKYIIVLVVGIAIGLFITKLYWPTTDKIKIIIDDTHYTKPITNDNCLECAKSKIDIDIKVNKNSIEGNVHDLCKSAKFVIDITPKINLNIIQISYLYQYHNEFIQSFGVAYLRNFGRFAIGCGIVASNKTFGIQGIAQVNF
jgi:hypothetical protein